MVSWDIHPGWSPLYTSHHMSTMLELWDHTMQGPCVFDWAYLFALSSEIFSLRLNETMQIFIKIIRKQKPPSESKKNTKTIIGSRLFRGHYTFRVWDEDQWFTNSLQFQCGRGRARIAQLVKAWICNLRIVGSCVTASEVLAFSKPLTPNC